MKLTLRQKTSNFFNKIRRKSLPRAGKNKGYKYPLKSKISTKNSSQEKKLFSNSLGNLASNKYFLFSLIGLLVLSFGYFIYSNIVFFQKFSVSKSPYDYESNLDPWNGKRRLNIAVIGMDAKDTGNIFIDRILILQVNPDSPQLGIFAVNTNYKVPLPNEQSTSIKNAFIVGKREDKPLEFVIEGTENLLGIGIERYVTVDSQQMDYIFNNSSIPTIDIKENIEDEDFATIKKGNRKPTPSEMYNYLATETDGEDMKMRRIVDYSKYTFSSYAGLNDILFSKSEILAVFQNLHTNLTKREVFNLFLFVRGLREDQIKVAYTREIGGIPGGVSGDIWDPIKTSIDNDLKIIFNNPEIAIEQARVEVLNSTDIGGLATTVGRTLENQGCRVVRVGNSADEFDENLIYVKNPDKYKKTIDEIKATFKGDVKVIREEYPSRNVGDIVVIIGNWE